MNNTVSANFVSKVLTSYIAGMMMDYATDIADVKEPVTPKLRNAIENEATTLAHTILWDIDEDGYHDLLNAMANKAIVVASGRLKEGVLC